MWQRLRRDVLSRVQSCQRVSPQGKGVFGAGWLRDVGPARPVASAWQEDEIPTWYSPSARREGENRQREGTEARTSVNGWKEFKLCEIEQELLKQLRITFKMWDLFYLV